MKLSGGQHKIGRVIGLCMALMWCGIAVPLLVAAAQEKVLPEILPIALGTGLIFGGVAWYMLSEYPCAEMTEEGICIRILFRDRFYRWDEIQQAGVLCRKGRNCNYNQLVLVPPKGSKRKYRDRWFLLRNSFTLVKLPLYSEEVREYVCRHYGPLDFNQSDGQLEKSIVSDNYE